MSTLGEQIRALSDEAAPILGDQPFVYSTWPTPTSATYVFKGGNHTAATALAHMVRVHAAVMARGALPEGYAYCCPVCAETFDTIDERDAHVRKRGLHR